MATILSSFDQLVNPSTQKAVNNAAANYGTSSVTLVWANENTDDAPIYDVIDTENEDYMCSIDTDGDVIFEK